MSDLESYLNRCYDLLLQQKKVAASDDVELCACAKLVENDQ